MVSQCLILCALRTSLLLESACHAKEGGAQATDFVKWLFFFGFFGGGDRRGGFISGGYVMDDWRRTLVILTLLSLVPKAGLEGPGGSFHGRQPVVGVENIRKSDGELKILVFSIGVLVKMMLSIITDLIDMPSW